MDPFMPLLQSGAAAAGCVALQRLVPFMTAEKQAKALSLCPGARTVLVGLYPYYVPGAGNLARYARGEDYHAALARRLLGAANALRAQYGGSFVPLVDISPLPEVRAAYLSGAGILGDNGLIFAPPFGPYVLIGCLLSDRSFDRSEAQPRRCLRCGACQKICPAGALSLGNDGFPQVDADRCLSQVTQRRGKLSSSEQAALARHPLIWGCDRCMECCPLSRGAQTTPLPEFADHLIFNLNEDDLLPLSDRAFRKKYANRAFSFRGAQPLKRNLSLVFKKQEPPE